MYKTFELFYKALYIIAFWSIIFFILETRKVGVSLVDTMIYTVAGWSVFLAIALGFLLFITSSHSKTREDAKKKITHEVVEDGMKFTVGGHIPFHNVLPKQLLIDSKPLNDYEVNIPIEQNIEKALNDSVQVVKELLIHEEIDENLSDKTDTKTTSIKNKVLNAESDIETAIVVDSNQSEEERAKEANDGFVPPDEVDEKDESRATNKGILFYKPQFEALYSYIINHKIHALQDSIQKGKLIVVSKAPADPNDDTWSGKKFITTAELKAKEIKLNAEAQALRKQIDETIEKVLEYIPKFKYEGIVSTTPKIKPVGTFDFSQYQLLIFTALFPFCSWFEFRSNRALNILDPRVAELLSKDETAKLDKSELGLNLRDKRILWNARNMYDIYLKRDEAELNGNISVLNMPISYDSNGKMHNTLEEAVALCEFFREAKTQHLAPPVTRVVKSSSLSTTSPYNDTDIISLLSRLFHEKNRFNTTNTQTRIGIIRNDLIYIDVDSLIPKFNGRFAEKYPKLANSYEFDKALNALYNALKKMNLLAMRKLKENSQIETYDIFCNGELFAIKWDFGKNNPELTIDSTLVMYASQMFKDIIQLNQESNAVPRIMGPSISRAIPHTEYAKVLEEQFAEMEKDKKERAVVKAVIAKEEKQQEQSETDILNQLNEALNDDVDEGIVEAPTGPTEKTVTTTENTDEQNAANNQLDTQEASNKADLILGKLYGADQKDLKEVISKIEGRSSIDANYYIDRDVQVLRLRLSPKDADKVIPENVNNEEKGRLHNYAVHIKRNDIKVLDYSRSQVNTVAETLELTFLKMLKFAKSKNYQGGEFTLDANSRKLSIKKESIYKLFNVYEQMAIYQKQGQQNLWGIKQEKYSSKKTVDIYDQIGVIECIDLIESQEESLYKTLDTELWTEPKVKELFEAVNRKLNALSREHKSRLKIKGSIHAGYSIPKAALGKLARLAVEINSLLAYIDQQGSSLKPELKKYKDQLIAIDSNGVPYISFGKIED